MAETCTNIYEARNRAASVMQAGKNDVARSRTVSALMIALTSLLTKHAWVTRKAIPSSARTTRAGLVTLADRVSRYVLAGHIRNKHAAGVTAVTTRLLSPHKNKCHTITFDNGKEFAEHELMEVDRLSHRPRKVLGFRTPHEVFFCVEVLYTKQPLVVALLRLHF